MTGAHLLVDGEPTTAEKLVGATADITTRQGDHHDGEVIRGYYAGRLVLRPADAWVQIDADDVARGFVHDDTPKADVRVVQVTDRGFSRSYEGVTVRTLTLVWTCPVCGGERGKPRDGRVIEDGWHYYVHVWDNPCGHHDMYAACLVEAGVHPAQPVRA